MATRRRTVCLSDDEWLAVQASHLDRTRMTCCVCYIDGWATTQESAPAHARRMVVPSCRNDEHAVCVACVAALRRLQVEQRQRQQVWERRDDAEEEARASPTNLEASAASEGTEGDRRRFTAAVPGMSVSEMRRCLAEVRTLLGSQSLESPFTIVAQLSNGMPAWQFVHEVALGLHKKRTHNRQRAKLAAPAS